MSISEKRQKELEELRREQILSVALQLFYHKGYTNTTISDIASAAGISKGLVYRYFDSKETILFAYKDAMYQCLQEISKMDSPLAAIKEAVSRLLSDPDITGYFAPLRIYMTVFIKGELTTRQEENPASEGFARTFLVSLFQRGIETGEFVPGDVNVYAEICWHYILGCLADSIQNKSTGWNPNSFDTVLSLFLPKSAEKES